jgi:hypothetical protein
MVVVRFVLLLLSLPIMFLSILLSIFRDVYLLAFPADSRIDDFFVKTDLDKSYKAASMEMMTLQM